jgi:2-polyprenyl-3-methyl-5-hydroxy-6-metoxy-1,4-benzoquinol methylase
MAGMIKAWLICVKLNYYGKMACERWHKRQFGCLTFCLRRLSFISYILFGDNFVLVQYNRGKWFWAVSYAEEHLPSNNICATRRNIMIKKVEWCEDFFKDFRPVFDLVPAKTTIAQIKFITEKLKLRSGTHFLDCACGIGRIALPLARKKIKVTASDFAKPYVDELALNAKEQRLKIETICRDMRKINFIRLFESAAIVGGSFGYFEKESDNQLVIKNIYRALKPGGRFLLSVVNRDWLLANFQDKMWQDCGDTFVLMERTFEYKTSRVLATWTFLRDGRKVSHHSVVRCYTLQEILEMFAAAGFADIQSFGSLKSDVVSSKSREIWLVGTRHK